MSQHQPSPKRASHYSGIQPMTDDACPIAEMRRMLAELSDLDQRISELKTFMDSLNWDFLTLHDADLAVEQHRAMVVYRSLLSSRLTRAIDGDPGEEDNA